MVVAVASAFKPPWAVATALVTYSPAAAALRELADW
jgi:hypothetical protein